MTPFPHLSRVAAWTMAALLLAACAPAHTPVAGAGATSAAAAVVPVPATTVAPAGAALQIDSANSLIAVTVRRGGMLARLGHDHVVAARTISGTVWPQAQRAQLQFRLDQMTVDEAALRQVAGLDRQPSREAIDGTRQNMLTKVLDADRYPLVTVIAEQQPGPPGLPLKVAITLHGVTRHYEIPATITQDQQSMTVSGTVNLKQTDFGLTPFSVMGGAMAVQDQMELRFVLVAR